MTNTGNSRGQKIMTQNLADIVDLLRTYPPLPMRTMSARLAKDMGLTPDTLSRNYLSVLENTGDLHCDRRGLWSLLEDAEVTPHRIEEKKPLSEEIHLGRHTKTVPLRTEDPDEGIPEEPYESNREDKKKEWDRLNEQRDRIRNGAQQK